MNESRYKSIISGLSSIESKVYGAFPESKYCSAAYMSSAILQAGIKQDPRVTLATMNTLKERGLLAESNGGLFAKVKISTKSREKKLLQLPTPTPTPVPDDAKQEPCLPAAPIDDRRVDSLLYTLRDMAMGFFDFSEKLNNLALDMDDELLRVSTIIQDSERDSATLKQLQSLLKSIG